MAYGEHKVNKRWFTDHLQDKKITQRKLAAELGIDPAAVSLMLDGKRKCLLSEAETIARVIQQPLDAVLINLGVDPTAGSADMVPLVGWVDGQGIVHMDETIRPKRVEAPAGLPANAVAVRFRTIGSGVSFRDGWLAYFVPGKDEVPADCLGRLCIVCKDDGTIAVRVPSRGYEPGKYNLLAISNAPAVTENRDLKWATPILWHKLV